MRGDTVSKYLILLSDAALHLLSHQSNEKYLDFMTSNTYKIIRDSTLILVLPNP